ncbi:MAG: hypothetical protein EPN93_17955 [Spirochaetes bacterium]|nr:MAG: hypothetical protein EPN93_17955 [Spirochaetota bacterium]
MIKTSIKSSSPGRYAIAILFAGALAVLSCGKPGGDFAFKKPMEDVYRKVAQPPEFEREEAVDWVFALKGLGGSPVKLAVFLVKKELVWVELHTRTESVTRDRAFIYGTIEGLKKGRYKIIIARGGDVVGEQEFDIYDETDDGVFD